MLVHFERDDIVNFDNWPTLLRTEQKTAISVARAVSQQTIRRE